MLDNLITKFVIWANSGPRLFTTRQLVSIMTTKFMLGIAVGFMLTKLFFICA